MNMKILHITICLASKIKICIYVYVEYKPKHLQSQEKKLCDFSEQL